MGKDMVWGMLLHLGSNMWGEWGALRSSPSSAELTIRRRRDSGKRPFGTFAGFVICVVAFCAVASADFPVPPNWEPILTRPGALAMRSGHVQGFCVTSNAIYATLHDGLYKFDWYGRLLMHVSADKHQGDICYWNGKLYTAVCIPKDVPKRGRIDVWDENLKKIGTTEFVRSADGIACIDGVLYVGLGPARDPAKPFRGNYFGKFDAETLQPIGEPFLVDHGYDVCAGVQNIATDGERLYINFYTPEENYPCFFVFDKDFKVLQSHVFGWRHGVDLVGGGEPGVVRLIYAVTLNCWSKASKLQLDPAPSQNLFLYAELKDGKISDLTRYIP